jgi:hypothetical protein
MFSELGHHRFELRHDVLGLGRLFEADEMIVQSPPGLDLDSRLGVLDPLTESGERTAVKRHYELQSGCPLSIEVGE